MEVVVKQSCKLENNDVPLQKETHEEEVEKEGIPQTTCNLNPCLQVEAEDESTSKSTKEMAQNDEGDDDTDEDELRDESLESRNESYIR